MKITMYELLGLVKDGKAPKKIKFYGVEWEYTGYQYKRIDKENLGNIWNGYNFNILNEEVEILEEEPRDIEMCGSLFTKSEYDKLFLEEEKKIPEKLDIVKEKNCNNNWKWQVKGEIYYYNMSTPQKIIADKLNEIIDYLDYLKSKGDE